MGVKKGKKELVGLLTNMARVMGIYFRMRPWFVLLYVVLMLGIATVPFGVAWVNGQLINRVVEFLGGADVDRWLIYQLLLVALIGGLLLRILYKLADLVDRLGSYDWDRKTPIDLARSVSGLDLAKLEDDRLRTKLQKVNDGIAYKAGNFVSRMFWMINDAVQIVVAVIILSQLAVFLLPVIFISLIPEFLVLVKGSKSLWGIWDAKESIFKRFNVAREKLTNIDSIQEVRIFGLRSYLLSLMDELMGIFVGEQKNILKKENKRSLLSAIFENVVFGAIEFWILLQVLVRKLGVGDYNFYLSSINKFTNSSRNLLRNINRMYEDSLYLTDFFELVDMGNELISKPGAKIVGGVKPPLIEFKNVSFAYPGSKKKVFENFSLVIESGEDVAIVGENGAGKTTMVKLLCRFYDVDEGEILIDGLNIKEVDLDSWYRNLGVLFQRFNTYGFSAYENIALGDIDKFGNKKELIKAAKMAGAHELIMTLKYKYKQILSKWFRKGTDLSFGQWQRIALARAFFRGANILILDEPTSAIDAKGEYEIFAKIAKYQKEKTTIIISHRFSTVRKANKIYVIKKGRIVEWGSHEELMRLGKGMYREMFELQAEGYR